MIEALRDTIGQHGAAYLALGGLVIGGVFGAVVFATNFCAMGSLSDVHNFGDWRRFRAWVLAATVALVGAQLLQAGGVVALDKSMYLAGSGLNWVGHILGGLMFGFGMGARRDFRAAAVGFGAGDGRQHRAAQPRRSRRPRRRSRIFAREPAGHWLHRRRCACLLLQGRALPLLGRARGLGHCCGIDRGSGLGAYRLGLRRHGNAARAADLAHLRAPGR
jgi:hypothetical protein